MNEFFLRNFLFGACFIGFSLFVPSLAMICLKHEFHFTNLNYPIRLFIDYLRLFLKPSINMPKNSKSHFLSMLMPMVWASL